MGIGKNIALLEDKLGYKFRDITLLETALTHTSYANEQKSRRIRNEKYQF